MFAAILTGHSRGLGAAVASALLDNGIPVLALARSGNPTLAGHPLLTEVALDLSDADAVAAWGTGPGLKTFIGDAVPVLINNAGTVTPIGPLGTQDPQQVVRAVALNVTAPLLVANAVLAAIPADRDARILHISSGAGRSPLPGWATYCATKAALDHHARTVVADARPGLRIASMAPGVVDTDMQAEIRSSAVEHFPQREKFEALKRDGALATPAAVAAKLVAYVLGDTFGDETLTDVRTLP